MFYWNQMSILAAYFLGIMVICVPCAIWLDNAYNLFDERSTLLCFMPIAFLFVYNPVISCFD